MLAVLNAVVRPLLVALSLPLIVRTLGLLLVVIDACLLKAVSWAVPGFFVDGIGPACFGAIFISIAAWLLGAWFSNGRSFHIAVRRDDGGDGGGEALPPIKSVRGRVIEP